MAGVIGSFVVLLMASSAAMGASLTCRDRVRPSASALRPTIYYTAEIDLRQPRCRPRHMVSVPGVPSIRLCARDLARCRLEGTCRIRGYEGQIRVINYHRRGRFLLADSRRCPYGYGASTGGKPICLIPFYSVAADRRYHMPGDVIFVPGLKGLRLPQGHGVHTGYVVVSDVGQAIKGPSRFDFFSGTMTDISRANPFVACGFGNQRQSVAFRKVHGAERAMALRRTGFPEFRLPADPVFRSSIPARSGTR